MRTGEPGKSRGEISGGEISGGEISRGEITALTGLRIVASLWVVLFHFRPMVADISPELRYNLAPLLNCGAQGVDLFFILSGFVLTYNYLDRMGHRFSLRATTHFLWLRLARVWPVYLVTLHLAAVWVIFTLHVGHTPSPDVGRLTAISYVRQVLLVQLWFQPFFDLSSWDGPAWSISAEWLAYLMFGLLVLVIWRIQHATRARGLMALAVAASLPPVVLLLSSGVFYTPWSWLPRIVTQFAAGALACAAVRRLRPTDRLRRIAGYLSLLILVAIVGIVYLLRDFPITGVYDSGGVVDLLFVPLVITLAIGVGGLPALLSTRLMVYGGEISFGLYMVHELVHTSWTWAVVNFELRPWVSDSAWKWNIFGLLAIALMLSVLLYHGVEEPARRWMRRMVDAPARPAGHNPDAPTVAVSEEEPAPAEPVAQPTDDAREAVPARAV